MRENRLSGSMRGEARRSLACASQSVRFAYSTYSSHSAVGIVLRTTPPGNRELHPGSLVRISDVSCSRFLLVIVIVIVIP